MIRYRSWCYVGVLLCAAIASPAQAQLTPRPQALVQSGCRPCRFVTANFAASCRTNRDNRSPVPSCRRSARPPSLPSRVRRPLHVPQSAGRSLSRSRAPAAVPSRARTSRAGRARREERHDDRLDASCRRDIRTDGSRRVGWRRRGQPAAQPAEPEHDHDEVAWRLRHLKRSVLKDAGEAIAQTGGDTTLFGDSLSGLESCGRSLGAARLVAVRRPVAQRAVQPADDDVVRSAAGSVLDERRRAAQRRLRVARSAGRRRRLDDARQHHAG